MSDVHDHSGLPEDELLAAEFALGVLADEDREAAERRIGRDRQFAARVAGWETRLAPWAETIAEVTPPPRVWEAISGTLPPPRRRSGIWQSLTFWRSFTLASGLLTAACIGALIYLGTIAPAPPLLAVINGGGHRNFIATVDANRATITVVPAAFTGQAGRVPELWLIPPGGKPHAVGLLSANSAVTISVPHELTAETTPNATLAVSLEPPGGSPTGQPTGPVIGTGKLTAL